MIKKIFKASAFSLVEMKSVSQGSQGTCPLRGPNLHKIKKILANRGDKQVTGAIDERRGISCVRSMSTTDSVIPFRENPGCLAMLWQSLTDNIIPLRDSMEDQSILLRPDTHRSLLRKPAFSLVEMLMALLVASLLLAALAPVMTKKFSENVNVSGSMGSYTTKQKTKEIEFGSEECSEIKTDADGSQYCEGEYTVKGGFNGYINVTVIGAGGGGGTAPTAGFVEYTAAGSTNTFTVPAMVSDIEATLISGGAGGGAGGQIQKTQTFVTYGNGNISANTNNIVTIDSDGTGSWTIPPAVRNKYLLATACGGGGGGSSTPGLDQNATWGIHYKDAGANGYSGGSGGYILNRAITFANADKFTYYIGGGGASGGGGSSTSEYFRQTGEDAKPYGGGGSAFKGASNGGGSGSRGGIGSNGELKTSSVLGGAGGIGKPNGQHLENDFGCGCSATSIIGIRTIRGGAGGQPGGGGGSSCQYCNAYNGSGGGGGGATQLVVGSGIYLNAPGGGGGGTIRINTINKCNQAGFIAAGGGGGGNGGGSGGSAGSLNGKGGANGVTGSGTTGGTVSTIFGSNYCNGGAGGVYGGLYTGAGGKSGAIRLTYLDYGPGGSGGGSGTIIPIQKEKVTPNEILKVIIGKGSKGGIGGKILDNGNIIQATDGEDSSIAPAGHAITKIIRESNNSMLYTTCWLNNASCGPIRGSHMGIVTSDGTMFGKGVGTNSNNTTGFGTYITVAGFSGENYAKAAGNSTNYGNITHPNGSTGGDGGVITTPFTGTCTPGKGGTSSNPTGGNATGYGCGGGGGYGLANGGAGSGGYARISWNKYWDAANSTYKLAETGAGGGGASGNIFTYSIPVKSNETIKFRIGKGGKGAYVSNNAVVQAAKGGDTAFGDVKAGGGLGGGSVSINSNALINGAGGAVSGTCHYKTTNYINNKKCIKGKKGYDAIGTAGGKGADFITYSYSVIDKDGNETKKEVKGEGGDGGMQGDNNNGKDAGFDKLYASGGGGAAIRDLGQVSAASQTNITKNETQGGAGSNGKIILEWYE